MWDSQALNFRSIVDLIKDHHQCLLISSNILMSIIILLNYLCLIAFFKLFCNDCQIQIIPKSIRIRINNNQYNLSVWQINLWKYLFIFPIKQYIYGREQYFKVLNVIGDQLFVNLELQNLINKLRKILLIKDNDIIIGFDEDCEIQQNQCLIIHLSTQQMSHSTKLYQNLQYYETSDFIGCKSKLQNLQCIGNKSSNKMYLWNIKQDIVKSSTIFRTNISALKEKNSIMIIQHFYPKNRLSLLISTQNKFKILRKWRASFSFTYHFIFSGYLYIENFFNSHQVLDLANMKIKQYVNNRQEQNITQFYIESQDILISAFQDKIKIFNIL